MLHMLAWLRRWLAGRAAGSAAMKAGDRADSHAALAMPVPLPFEKLKVGA
jgi:hypothetical protein